ncbi:MAG: glycosyltransferase, partial [SAR324 cluster bacterium]|nr:glycosyltransferase [SAR324 cluster bacterium]
LEELTEDCDNVLLAGHVGRAEISVLMERCSVALAPYRSTWDFMASIPTKAIEYLAGGVPILSSLKGELENLLSQNNCGITYANEDPKTFVEQLLWLYDHPGKRAEMSRNAKRLFDREFAAEKVYQNMADHLQSIVSAYRRRAI